jgi:hypothetical protein
MPTKRFPGIGRLSGRDVWLVRFHYWYQSLQGRLHRRREREKKAKKRAKKKLPSP